MRSPEGKDSSRIRSLTLQELSGLVGQEIAVSDWTMITQERIDQFGAATGDHQWIHVDPERAKQSPFGGTIAHGFLTLSLLSGFRTGCVVVSDARMSVNYGLNRVRFTSPVPVGSRVRGRFSLLSAEQLKDGAWQFVWESIVQIEGGNKPACVAEAVSRYYA